MFNTTGRNKTVPFTKILFLMITGGILLLTTASNYPTSEGAVTITIYQDLDRDTIIKLIKTVDDIHSDLERIADRVIDDIDSFSAREALEKALSSKDDEICRLAEKDKYEFIKNGSTAYLIDRLRSYCVGYRSAMFDALNSLDKPGARESLTNSLVDLFTQVSEMALRKYSNLANQRTDSDYINTKMELYEMLNDIATESLSMLE